MSTLFPPESAHQPPSPYSSSEKPPGAWTTEQCVDQLIKSLNAGDFYVLCEDNDVKRWQDEKRMQWNVDDVIKNRSALSRWDPKHKDDFEVFMKQ
jgi:hypothetical protein